MATIPGDDDVCRVCRSEGTIEDPLFHPCKCSGSIRYVHQDCLMEWLNHSQKRHCELCKTSFQFTKLYDPTMPKRLPLRQMLKRIGHDLRHGVLLGLRWILVAFVWLAWLPYCARHIWRSSIRAGAPKSILTSGNNTQSNRSNSTGSFLPLHLHTITPSEQFNNLILDIMEGQVITSVIIVIFVVVFLIREWIVQNNAILLAESPAFLMADMPMPGPPSPPAPVDPQSRPNDDDRQQDLAEPRTLIPRQPTVARNNHGSTPVTDTRHLGDAELAGMFNSANADDNITTNGQLILQDVNPADDALLTTAELRLLRREAVLRATSQRLIAQDSATTSEQSPGPVPLSTLRLDRELAIEQGHTSAEEARLRAARQRSAERKLWENSEAVPGESYPDSPMPPQLPEESLEEVEDFELDAEVRTKPQFVDETEHNPFSAEPYDDSTTYTLARSLALDDSPDLTETRTVLEQIRVASDVEERTRIANDAIQSMLDSSGLRHPNTPIDRASPAYRNFMRSAGMIAMTANEYGVNPALDIEQVHAMLQASTELNGQSQRPASNNALAAAAQANREIGMDQDGMRELQAAVVEARVEADVLVNQARNQPNLVNDAEDDIDGLLELIGVRGPLLALLQNSMLVVIMISGFILFGICVPFIIGRLVLAVTRHPRETLIDSPLSILTFMKVNSVAQTSRAQRFLELLIHHSRSLKYTAILIGKVYHYFVLVWKWLSDIHSSIEMPSMLQAVYERATILPDSLHHLALPHLTLERPSMRTAIFPAQTLSLLCGYMVCITAGSIYLKANKRLTSGEQGKQVEIALRATLRQAGFVLKFIAVLGVELVVFPFYCGVLLDIVFVPFFQSATISGRFLFFSRFPFTGLFLHWLIGTIYMFNFALFVSMCREIVRPGVLFFIRDPNDPAFNPIKDILERPLRNQLRKIGVSVMIYGALILGAFGSVLLVVAKGFSSVLPLAWGAGEPLFEIPFDLLLFQVLVPLTIRFVKPHQILKGIWKQWFISMAHVLRLSSFMIGERRPTEEGHIAGQTRASQILLAYRNEVTHKHFVKDGSFRRVPNTDSLPIRKDRFMIMEVTEENVLLSAQDLDSATDGDPNYTVVYTPPQFYLRIYLFLTAMWLFAALLGIGSTMLPLVFGRKIFKAVSPSATDHDLFSYLYGAYAFGFALWSIHLVVKGTHGLLRHFGTLWHSMQDPERAYQHVRSALIFVGKWAYLMSTMSILIPTLLGLCLETYLIVPLGIWYSPDYTPTVHLVHDWVVGLIYVKIFGRTAVMIPHSTLGQALSAIVHNDWRNGWRNPDIGIATRRLVLPLTASLLGALLLPLTVGVIGRKTIYRDVSDDVATMVYRMSYPAALLSFLGLLALKGALYLVGKWRASIRDSLYLKGQQLHNFGEVPSTTSRAGQTSEPISTASTSAAIAPQVDQPLEANEHLREVDPH